ncbi:MAG: hypothetical protein ACLR9T_11515 [Thomasclavelia sp.]
MKYKDFNLTSKGMFTIVVGVLMLGAVLANLSTYLVDLIIL